MSDKISDDDLEALVDYFAPPNNSSTGKDVHIALRELQSRRAQDNGKAYRVHAEATMRAIDADLRAAIESGYDIECRKDASEAGAKGDRSNNDYQEQ